MGMKVCRYPGEETLGSLLERPVGDLAGLEKSVRKIMEAVRKSGDRSLRKFTQQLDGVTIRKIEVSAKEIRAAESLLDQELVDAIRVAAGNIRRFHQAQVSEEPAMETMKGVTCWRKSVPIQKVGLYIPGGTAPLFSTVLMLALPAMIAGCPEIVLCSPPGKDGQLHPAILFAAKEAGIKKIYRVGGVQAIAAMAYGTASVPRVHKIFGPGNGYVTMAKQLAQQSGVAIDMPAGPSEVCVIADAAAHPAHVAADLLSQAEHGLDSQVVLLTDDEALIQKVLDELDLQLARLERRAMAEGALAHSKAILARDMHDCIRISNRYAPEHLIINASNASALANLVTDAGSVFIGPFTPESAGDYASGTNHTLPTNGYARAYSGVSVDSYLKKITFQQISEEGLKRIGPAIMTMAAAEGLNGHGEAVRLRLSSISNQPYV
jgi:histidinol dehydrogenase